MLKYFLKLKSRKGFTIVELIVVIGVIAVLAAITIPMSMGAGLVREAASKAKNFYYSLQNVLVDYRSAGETEPFYTIVNGATTENLNEGGYMYIEATAVKSQGGITNVNVAIVNPPSGSSVDTTRSYSGLASPTVDNNLKEKLASFFSDDDYGYYYALVDSKCRVVDTYWCSLSLNEITDTDIFSTSVPMTNTENDKIGNIIVGSFPENVSAKDCDMFMVPVTT